jgi:uncharacterized membrane protein
VIAAADPAPETTFEALIVPHRSMSARGVTVLSLAIAGVSLLLALRFWFIGAWPVVCFTVVEVGLATFLMRLNLLHARQSEMLLLSEERLKVVRTDWRGRRSECALPAAWLRVRLEERPARVSRLVVATRDGEEEIGESLGETEKQALATALRDALQRTRRPVFDNQQLR